MKIGFFTDRYWPAIDGVTISVDIFAKELRKLGHEVYIFCPEGPGKNSDKDKHIIRYKSFPGIWYDDYRDTLPWSRRNIKQVKDLELDIIHTHTPAQVGMLGSHVAKVQNIPLVTTYHTDLEQYFRVYKRILPGAVALSLIGPLMMKQNTLLKDVVKNMKPERSFDKWNRKIVRKMLTLYHNNCDLVIAPSEKIKKLLIAYHTQTPIEVISTGVNLDEPALHSTIDMRAGYDIPDQAFVLTYVGRLGQEKNIELIFQSLPRIIKELPATSLLIVGDGPYRNKLVDLVEKLNLHNHVIFTGMLARAETLSCFKAADIFVFPSLTETQGLVINEACAVSKPIIFIDDTISNLTRDGINGFKVRNNVVDFAKKTIILLKDNNLRQEFGYHSGELAQQHTAAAQTKKLEQVYSELIANRLSKPV